MVQRLSLISRLVILAVALTLADPTGRIVLSAPYDYAEISRMVSSAVVYVEVTYQSGRKASGSGFVVDPQGWILTARHVVAGAKRISVTFLPHVLQKPKSVIDLLSPQPSTFPASLVASLEESDMALLRINVSNLPNAPLENPVEMGGNLAQGDEVLVFGFPGGKALGTSDVTVTRGIVSAFRSPATIPLFVFQIDAAINPGNSGGPLVAVKSGKVVGMVFARIPRFQSVNFAIDIYGALPLLLKIPDGPRKFRRTR